MVCFGAPRRGRCCLLMGSCAAEASSALGAGKSGGEGSTERPLLPVSLCYGVALPSRCPRD